jgi:hypothetical protein
MRWRARLPRADDVAQPVTDADTLWLETDQGDHDRKLRACRLWGVWAPEMKDTGGPECRAFVAAWVDAHHVGRWPLWVDTIQTSTGRDVLTYNRFVTVVWNGDRTRQLNVDVHEFITQRGYGGGIGAS